MDGPFYAITGVFLALIVAMVLGVYVEGRNAHELRLECIKAGNELVGDNCIHNRNGAVSKL